MKYEERKKTKESTGPFYQLLGCLLPHLVVLLSPYRHMHQEKEGNDGDAAVTGTRCLFFSLIKPS
jgi:hypothetical protein